MADAPLIKAKTTNKEKEDLTEPLAVATKDDITKVVLYQSPASPPCCKIRAVLKRYEVPFETIYGKKPDSDYTKIPILMVNEQQINDSYIIVKTLAPLLDGQKLSPELLELEELNTFGLQPALEIALMETASDLRKYSSLFGGFLGSMIFLLSCCLPFCAPNAIRKKNPEVKTVKEYGVQIAEKLKGMDYFHGEKPGIVDVSIYGVIEPFFKVDAECADVLLKCGLEEWHARMAKIVPSIW